MDANTLGLLRQGLIVTGIGMGLVFAALALLWGMMRLLEVVFRDRTDDGESEASVVSAEDVRAAEAAAEAEAALTAERARVAAIVAGALLSNALPLLLEPPIGPAFEHGRTAPSWVTANRARVLGAWSPPRTPESHPLVERYT